MFSFSLRRFLILLLAAIIVVGQINGCATNPVSGTPEVVFMSETQEIELGRTNDVKVRNQYGVYDNPELQAYVSRVGQKLAAQSHRPGLVYQFTVLDSPEVNAFALPGGYIYITRGILAYINSEAELAAVLGHEIGHVTARHSVRQYTASMATGVVGAIIGATTGVRGTQDLFNVLGNALLSGYGRDHELESDRLGAEYLARSGYDPQAMIQVIGILKNQEEFEKQRAAAEKRAPRIYHGVFASHPSADKRLQEVVGEADKFKTLTAPVIARDEYLVRLDNLIYGDNAKEGVRFGNSFYHRDLNFALDFPAGWQIENTPQAIRAGNPEKTAILIVQAETATKDLPPNDFLNLRMNFAALDQAGPIEGVSLPSYTGIAATTAAFGKRRTRVATLYFNDRRFLFQGATKDASTFTATDPLFMSAIRSFRPLSEKEKKLAEGMRVRVERARPGDTFTSLAKKSPITDYSELTLRLINDKYPDGEPRPGELIKIIR